MCGSLPDDFQAKLDRAAAAMTPHERHARMTGYWRVTHNQPNASEHTALGDVREMFRTLADDLADEIAALPDTEPDRAPGPIRSSLHVSPADLVASTRTVHAVARDALVAGLRDVLTVADVLDLADSAVSAAEHDYDAADDKLEPSRAISRTLVAAPGAPSVAVITTAN